MNTRKYLDEFDSLFFGSVGFLVLAITLIVMSIVKAVFNPPIWTLIVLFIAGITILAIVFTLHIVHNVSRVNEIDKTEKKRAEYVKTHEKETTDEAIHKIKERTDNITFLSGILDEPYINRCGLPDPFTGCPRIRSFVEAVKYWRSEPYEIYRVFEYCSELCCHYKKWDLTQLLPKKEEKKEENKK